MRLFHPTAADHSVSIRGSRCTALIHPFASEPSGGASLLLSYPASEKERASAGITAQQRWSRSHGKEAISVKTVTLGVCGGQLPCVLQH